MSGDLVLALDLGTTSVRALVVAADGSVRSRAARPLAARFPFPGWLEQDPLELWASSAAVLEQALSEAGEQARGIAGLGVVTQRATCLAWDARTGEPLAPAVGWQDQRSAERVAELRALGIPINTLASATKFEWWMRNDAAVRQAAKAGTLRLGTPDSWLTYRLTGGDAHVTDPGNASCTALYDPTADAFAPPLCELFELPFESLPRVAGTGEIVGETDASWLGAPIAVAARAGDQQAAAFAQGVRTPGDAKLTLGTSAMLDVHTGDAPAEMRPGAYPLALWRLADGSRAFCLEGTVITAGACVDWLVDLGFARDAAGVVALAEGATSSEGVMFVPALQGLGTPFLDDDARGALFGLTRGSGRAAIARAVLEGISQRCIDVIDELLEGDGAIGIDGGLARSRLVAQALADGSGREIRRAAETETTALGAAFLAGLTTGVWASHEDCLSVRAAPESFAPGSRDTDARARWAGVLERVRDS